MRMYVLLAGLACLLAAVAGCDTTQPLQTGEQTLEINFTASNASAYQYDVWDEFLDLDGDGEFDEGSETMQRTCELVMVVQVPGNPAAPVSESTSSVPWPYSLEIRLIRAGETEAEVITTTDALDSQFNLTPYDDWQAVSQPIPSNCRNNPDLVCLPLGRVTAANQLVVESTFSQDDIFRCPGFPIADPIPRMDGTVAAPGTPPFSVTVNKGDTVIVNARKHIEGVAGVELVTVNDPTLNGFIFLDGLPVTPQGVTTSTTDNGSGVSFSFTVQ